MYTDADDYIDFGTAEPVADYSKHNDEMNLAWQFIANTNVSVFLTGKAGTGKTTFLRRLRELSPKRMVVLAPTGVAAINAGGQTIHSFFQLSFGPYVPGSAADDSKHKYKMAQWKKDLIRTLDLLVIDEVSMVRADLLDQIDDTLRKYRNPTLPFGGVQLLLIGDLMQLSPVAGEEWGMLSQYYQTPYFFSSRALQQLRYVTVELRHIYRQQDQEFIDILGQVRSGLLTPETIATLNSRYDPTLNVEDKGWIRLTTHNATAQQYNAMRLSMLPTPEATYSAQLKGDFPEGSYPTELTLTLKVGAQVMFIKNDAIGGYYNGKIGIVTDIKDDSVEVTCEEDDRIQVVPAVWENTKYTLDPKTNEIRDEVVGAFAQLPLRLAWAITVHKSQGLTFEHAVLDINASFAHGQVYVALSRCRTLQGLALTEPLRMTSVKTDYSVNSYIDRELQSIPSNVQQLPRYKYEYKLSLLDELYSFDSISRGYAWLIRVVDEHLSSQQPELLQMLKDGSRQVETRLTAVAAKFRQQYQQLMQQYGGNIASSPLSKRIMDSAVYFGKCITEIFIPIFNHSAIHIENKQVAQTYNNAVQALKQDVVTKWLIFDRLAEETFGTSAYLNIKAKAMLDAQKMSLPGQEVKKPVKSDKPKKEKPKKGNTVLETQRLYESGLTVQQICEYRQLQPSTIYAHLAALVARGDIALDDVVSPERQRLIRDVVAQFTEAYTLSDVKKLLPEDVTFGEIRMTLADDSIRL